MIMNKKHKIWIAVLALLIVSCNSTYLDKMEEAEGYTFETVFMDSTNYRDFVNYLLVNPAFLPLQNGVKPLGNLDDISDNSISTATYGGVPSVQAQHGDFYMMRGNADAVQCNNDTWAQIWKNIRIANTGIRNIEYYTGSESSKQRILGMCYFFRAFYYMELTRRWGGMPYLYAPLDASDDFDLPRLSMQETYKLAAIDCDSAVMFLRNTVSPSEFQNPTRVGALALKSRCLLYAASDQARTENHESNPKENLWEAAALAANEALRAAEDNGYELVPYGDALNGDDGYYFLFKENQYETYMKEILHGRRAQIAWGSDAYINTSRPPGQLGGKYGIAVNQLLVDCFEMQDTGLPITDPNSGYKAQDPYSGRDPRFYNNVIYNQSRVFGNMTMQIWQEEEGKGITGSLDLSMTGQGPVMGFTQTGYYMRKWMGKTWNVALPQLFSWIRLAEVYLNYAEAANEAWNDPATRDSRCKYSAVEALNIIRNRAKMPDLNAKFMNKTGFRDRVRNERRIELCFEEHRLFDVRRWLIGTQPEYRDIWRMRIVKLADGYNPAAYPTGFQYIPELFMRRVYEDRNNLFAIRDNATQIGPNFKQNPGW
jgi:hypothetical protein